MEKKKLEKKKKKLEKKKQLTWQDRKQIAIGIAKGLEHMHKACIAHCDLKPGNIMLAKDDDAKIAHEDIKLIDFGASISFLEDMTLGTDAYCLEGERTTASPERDIFAFGTILIHLLMGNSEVEIHGKHAKTESVQTHARGMKAIGLAQQGLVNKKNRAEIEEFAELATDCVKEDPKSRPTIEDVLAVLVKKTT